jgi:hypothetical protein
MRALDSLEGVRLVDLGSHGSPVRYEEFHLLSDDGLQDPYLVPAANELVGVSIPSVFFYHGWHLVLEPAEIAMLFAVIDYGQWNRATKISLYRRARWEYYGISPEVYSSIHELEEFRLLAVVDPMPSRRHGRLQTTPNLREDDEASQAPVPYQLTYSPAVLYRPAWEVVHGAMTRFPAPPRFAR